MRKKFKDTGEIPVTEIMLDTTNFRIGDTEDQLECRELLFDEFGEQIVNIAAHIANNGLSPKPIVVKPTDGKWVVRDGNRRIAALQTLNNPALAPDEYRPAFEALKDGAKGNGMIPTAVSCLTSDDDKAILDYMQLEHLGPQGGIGQVTWGPREKDNMLLALGGKARNAIARAVCDYLTSHGLGQAKTVKITNIQRLLQDTSIQNQLGLAWDGTSIKFALSEDGVRNVLKEIVIDFTDRKKRVSSIYTAEDRQKYIDELFGPRGLQPQPVPAPAAPTPKASGSAQGTAPPPPSSGTQPTPTQTPVSGQGGAVSPTPIPVPAKPPRMRTRLIPKNQGLNVPTTVPKVISIIYELGKGIEVQKAPISASVLLRLLIEFSVRNYMDTHKLSVTKDKLHLKIEAVARHLEAAKKISDKHRETLCKMHDSNKLLSAHTLNQYVHNSDFTPTSQELCTYWDNLYYFLRLCW